VIEGRDGPPRHPDDRRYEICETLATNETLLLVTWISAEHVVIPGMAPLQQAQPTQILLSSVLGHRTEAVELVGDVVEETLLAEEGTSIVMIEIATTIRETACQIALTDHAADRPYAGSVIQETIESLTGESDLCQGSTILTLDPQALPNQDYVP
jgi:hypothetical protein